MGRLRVLELYCGMGGCSAALQSAFPSAEVIAAVDQSAGALSIFKRNFPQTPTIQANLEHATADGLRSFDADVWWLSPPCQPYTVKGARKDLEDPRATSFLQLLRLLPECVPPSLALENVEGFANSRARATLIETLDRLGYAVLERILCPSELGIPNRRPRYYLAASRLETPCAAPLIKEKRRLADYLLPPGEIEALYGDMLTVEEAAYARYENGLRVLDPSDPEAYATCFTSSYGKTWMKSGSFLRDRGKIRRFSPEEIARILHFPTSVSFPEEIPLLKRWHHAGNSLCVAAVHQILLSLPQIRSGSSALS